MILNDSITLGPSNSVIKTEKSTELAASSSVLSVTEEGSKVDPAVKERSFSKDVAEQTTRPSTADTSLSHESGVPSVAKSIRGKSNAGSSSSLQIRTDLNTTHDSGMPTPTPGKNADDPSGFNTSGQTTTKNSKSTSRLPSRVPSREGLTPGKQRYVLANGNDQFGGGGASGAMSRQSSWMLSKSPSFKEELSEIKTRLRQLHQQDGEYAEGEGGNGTGFGENAASNDPHYHERQEMLEDIIEKIYLNVRAGQTVVPIDWNMIKFIAPKGNQKKEEKTTSTDDLEEWIHKKLYELPIFDNQNDILVTRSYKMSPEQLSFHEKLQRASNPLFLLYTEFHPYLSQLQKERLFYASLLATMKQHNEASDAPSLPMVPTAMPKMEVVIAQRNRSHILAASHHILASANKLQDECTALLPLVNAIESLVNDSVQIVKSLHRSPAAIVSQLADLPNVQFLMNSLTDLFHLMGIVEAQEITTNLRLAELRSFFESIQAMNIKELGILLQESTELNEAYGRFSETQGSMVSNICLV